MYPFQESKAPAVDAGVANEHVSPAVEAGVDDEYVSAISHAEHGLSQPAVCGSTMAPVLPSRPAVSTRSHLGWKVVPSAFKEALMQYFQAADLLSQPGHISDGKSYHLHSWRLSCNTSKQQGFQKRSLDSLHSYETLKAALWAPERGIDPLGPAAAQVPSFPLKGPQHNTSDGQGLPVLPGFGTQSYRQG